MAGVLSLQCSNSSSTANPPIDVDASADLDAAGDGNTPLDDSGAVRDDAGVVLADPTAIHGDKLVLWLRADLGLACDTNVAPPRVTTWADQSGAHHDAVAGIHLGPQCGEPAGAINGIPVPYFTAPGTNNANETLDVAIDDVLKGTSYTVAAVERRIGALVDTGASSYWGAVLGTELPLGGSEANRALVFGYVAPNNTGNDETFTFDQLYNGVSTPAAYNDAAKGVHVDIGIMNVDPISGGRTLYRDGAKVAESTSSQPLLDAKRFGIGRAWSATRTRFRGQIAEVVVYRAALSDAERVALEANWKAKWGLAW